MTDQELEVRARLEALGIAFDRHGHPPIDTAEAGEQYWTGIDAIHCKNLFMRNQKGTKHYLVILNYLKRANLRAVSDQVGDGKLSFASPERLMTHLGVADGLDGQPIAVNPHDQKMVRVVLDRDLKSADRISFHPNINTATVVLAFADFLRFLDWCGNPVQYVSV
jgi:Ala-tRNA(Pro) deacylase